MKDVDGKEIVAGDFVEMLHDFVSMANVLKDERYVVLSGKEVEQMSDWGVSPGRVYVKILKRDEEYRNEMPFWTIDPIKVRRVENNYQSIYNAHNARTGEEFFIEKYSFEPNRKLEYRILTSGELIKPEGIILLKRFILPEETIEKIKKGEINGDD